MNGKKKNIKEVLIYEFNSKIYGNERFIRMMSGNYKVDSNQSFTKEQVNFINKAIKEALQKVNKK